MDTAASLSLGLMALALSSSMVFIAITTGKAMRNIADLAETHRKDLRAVTNWALNTTRVYSNEFLRTSIKTTIPEVDERLTQIQQDLGIGRGEAVKRMLEELDQNGQETSTPSR